jgi:DICT domain-containing protein
MSHPSKDTTTRLDSLTLMGGLDDAQLRLHSRTTMIALSHLLEDLAAGAGGRLLIATFQRLSLFRSEAMRYARLVTAYERIYAVGVPDITPPQIPGVTIVPIAPESLLAQEWVVITSGPSWCAALFARDAEGFRLERRSRRYKGLWTTEPRLIDRATAAFLDALGEAPEETTRDPRASFNAMQAMQAGLAQERARERR